MSKTLTYDDLMHIIQRQEDEIQKLIEINQNSISERNKIIKLFEGYSESFKKQMEVVIDFKKRLKMVEDEVAFLTKHIYTIKKKKLLDIKWDKERYPHWVCKCEQINSNLRTKCISCNATRTGKEAVTGG